MVIRAVPLQQLNFLYDQRLLAVMLFQLWFLYCILLVVIVVVAIK